MAKRKKKIDLKQLLKDADQLLIPRAMLVKQYGLKNKASLRSMLYIARKKYPGTKLGDSRPQKLTYNEQLERGRRGLSNTDWVSQPTEVRSAFTTARMPRDPAWEIPATAIEMRVEYPPITKEETEENNDEYERYLREQQIERHKNWEDRNKNWDGR